MDFPFLKNAPAEAPDKAAGSDEFWAFNPQQPPVAAAGPAEETSLDELLAYFQTPQDKPAAPFAPMGEPESYPNFPAAEEGGFDFGAPGGFDFGGPEPAPAFDFSVPEGGFDFGAVSSDAAPAFDFTPAEGGFELGAPAAEAAPAFDFAPAAEPAEGFSFAMPEPAAFSFGESASDGGLEELTQDFASGPIFPAIEPAAEEEVTFFMPDEEGPVFPPLSEEKPALAPERAPAIVLGPPIEETPISLPAPAIALGAPEPVPEPVFEARPEPREQADTERTLRHPTIPAPLLDLGELGQDLLIRTPEEREAANLQLSKALGSLNAGLDEVQGKMSGLYGELQRAAVRRAPVEDIQQIAASLAQVKATVAAGSSLHHQALYLRQLADAYLRLMQEL